MTHPFRAARLLFTALGLVLGLAMGPAAPARAQTIQSGREYIVLDPPHPVATGSRIEVIEFFYYGCPICYEFQPQLMRWLNTAPEYVAFRVVPVVSMGVSKPAGSTGTEPASATSGPDSYDTFAKLYYALDSLGDAGRLHWPVYDNYHFDGVKLNEEPVMFDWVARNGVDRDRFIAAYNSDAVKQKLAESESLMKAYDVKGVPTVIVDGKYFTSGRLAGSTKRLAEVVDQLVKRARAERPN
jgi:thiol:disulfide interchange protein DsbA